MTARSYDSSIPSPAEPGSYVAGPRASAAPWLASALALIAPLVSACGPETLTSASSVRPTTEETADPPDAPPTFPPRTTLHADAAGCLGGVPRTVDLHWSEASDDIAVQRYLVFLDDTHVAKVDAPAESAELLDVSFATPRTFAVVAVDEAGNESTTTG